MNNNLTFLIVRSDSDDSSMNESDIELRPKGGKSLAQRTREELIFSEGEEEDDEVLLAHREEMVQFMIDVHRRRKRVIEEYEKKEAVSLSLKYPNRQLKSFYRAVI
jgi:DNA helicase INO80